MEELAEPEELESSHQEVQGRGKRVGGFEPKSARLRVSRPEYAREMETPASNTDFVSIDEDREALGEDYLDAEVTPRSQEQEARGRSRQEVYTLHHSTWPQQDAPNRPRNSLQETPRIHSGRS